MDERQQRIEPLNQLQQPDRRDGVDGFDLDHPGLPSLQIDGAVNVDALSPAGLLDGELATGRGPTAGGAHGVGGMHRVDEQHGLAGGQGVQQLFITLDECPLLVFVELARDDFRLVICKAKAVQQRDQPRAAFVRRGRIPSRPRRRSGASNAAMSPRPRPSASLVARRSSGRRCRPLRNAASQ